MTRSAPAAVAGLCSVTYRALPAESVLRLASDSGLCVIEWGGDVHAPPGDRGRLARLGAATRAHGLRVASYGSYFRAGPHSVEEFTPALEAAVALGAPRIRIWAGTLGSRQASREEADAVAAQAREAGRRAAEHGVEVGFEFHGGTLTDSVDSTLRLLDAVDLPNVSTYWQPPVDAPADAAVAGLEALREQVCALHVFSWWPGTQRLRLAERQDLWRRVLAVAAAHGRAWDALLEFVPGDDPGALAAEAAALRTLIEAASGSAARTAAAGSDRTGETTGTGEAAP